MDAAYLSETVELTCRTTAQWNNLEYQELNLYLRKNLKSCGNGQPVFEIVFSREMMTGGKHQPEFYSSFLRR